MAGLCKHAAPIDLIFEFDDGTWKICRISNLLKRSKFECRHIQMPTSSHPYFHPRICIPYFTHCHIRIPAFHQMQLRIINYMSHLYCRVKPAITRANIDCRHCPLSFCTADIVLLSCYSSPVHTIYTCFVFGEFCSVVLPNFFFRCRLWPPGGRRPGSLKNPL